MLTIDALLSEGTPPVIAILRGLRPKEAVPIGQSLIDAGVRMIEVPLNSPDPFDSISALQAAFGALALIGAGTVLNLADVDNLAATGARLMVTPNTVPSVIARGVTHGLEVMPGFLTPSEAFVALDAGARRLKLFPAMVAGIDLIRGVREVLPENAGIWAVGGVNAANAVAWIDAGAEGVALGTSLYRPGDLPHDVGAKASKIVEALSGRRLSLNAINR